MSVLATALTPLIPNQAVLHESVRVIVLVGDLLTWWCSFKVCKHMWVASIDSEHIIYQELLALFLAGCNSCPHGFVGGAWVRRMAMAIKLSLYSFRVLSAHSTLVALKIFASHC